MNKLVTGLALGMLAGYMLCDNTPCIKKIVNKGKKKVRDILD